MWRSRSQEILTLLIILVCGWTSVTFFSIPTLIRDHCWLDKSMLARNVSVSGKIPPFAVVRLRHMRFPAHPPDFWHPCRVRGAVYFQRQDLQSRRQLASLSGALRTHVLRALRLHRGASSNTLPNIYSCIAHFFSPEWSLFAMCVFLFVWGFF